MSSPWTQISKIKWERNDGAAVKWGQFGSPHPNPANPNSRMWIAFEPDPSDRCLTMRRGRLGFAIRFKTAQAAMARLDKLYPPL
jgi:hypothetical protein